MSMKSAFKNINYDDAAMALALAYANDPSIQKELVNKEAYVWSSPENKPTAEETMLAFRDAILATLPEDTSERLLFTATHILSALVAKRVYGKDFGIGERSGTSA
jgi:hypothetical protein